MTLTLRPTERLERVRAVDLRIGDEVLQAGRGLVTEIRVTGTEVEFATIGSRLDRWDPVHPTALVEVVRPAHAPDRAESVPNAIDAALQELDAAVRDGLASMTVGEEVGERPGGEIVHVPAGGVVTTAEVVDAEIVDGDLGKHELTEGSGGRPVVEITCRFCDHSPFYGHGQRTNHERAKHPRQRAELERAHPEERTR